MIVIAGRYESTTKQNQKKKVHKIQGGKETKTNRQIEKKINGDKEKESRESIV